ncbi:tripartite tricarboxylate transporter substrate binding protein [Kaustia mangrovi]|uniref:Tripartite tricarboxylate transporter substrate binding protein n=1 Tax=Kaustia mangrovi TaxID=2593653 RepID=A0A7S8HBD2_9HYPH|nr:tripartite tricarboxylate transporter substrate binding protein [Kaustia mangrovi]QPC42374.1 tripartite tricarboxylate transporter substrate binding protein [Kaustia mangrovi]
MHFTRRTILGGLAGLALAAAGAGSALAFPDKAVEYIIPFGPGGESDISARLQQPYFQEKFGQDLVISYKPGGGGAVGWSQLNSYAGDGYTVMGVNLPHIVIQPATKDVGYTTDGLTPIYWFHYTPDAIVVPADSQFKTLQDLIDYAKENPGKLTLSGSGKGTANHLASIRFDELAGIKSTYVAFKGTGAAVTALLGNQVMAEWGYTTVGAKQGDKVRMLAVAMDERHPLFPDVPTFQELGFDMVGGAYRGVAVPESTPEELREQWSDMIGEINADEKFQKQMIDGGFALIDVPYGEMDAFMMERKAQYLEAAKAAGIIK